MNEEIPVKPKLKVKDKKTRLGLALIALGQSLMAGGVSNAVLGDHVSFAIALIGVLGWLTSSAGAFVNTMYGQDAPQTHE